MDEVKEFKRFLGPGREGYSDAQLRQLHREMSAMVELLLDIYLEKKRNSDRRPPQDFDTARS